VSKRTLERKEREETNQMVKINTSFAYSPPLYVTFSIVSWIAVQEFMQLWSYVVEEELVPGVADRHVWRLSSSKAYCAKSAYEAMF
jgi:hypothetical protein